MTGRVAGDRRPLDLPPLHVLVGDEEAGLAGDEGPGREDFGGVVDRLLAAGEGEVALHLRLRRATGRRIHELAARVREGADRHGGWCVVNDRVDVALTAGADAVQLGGESLPVTAARRVLEEEAAVGRSVHGVGAARRAAGDGANYLVLGTIYPTPGHPERPGAGPGLVQEVVDEVGRNGPPVVAIGGVDAGRVPDVRSAGADGVAVRRAVWTAADPAAAVRELLGAWTET